MKVLEMCNKGVSRGFFSLEEIEILNDPLCMPQTQEEFDEFIKREVDFRENLVYELEGFLEPIDDDNETFCQMEGFNQFTILDLIKKIKTLTSEDVKLLYEALFSASYFFDTFLIGDPMMELARLKNERDVFEKGYSTYKKSYEDLSIQIRSEIELIKYELKSDIQELNTLIGLAEGTFSMKNEKMNKLH